MNCFSRWVAIGLLLGTSLVRGAQGEVDLAVRLGELDRALFDAVFNTCDLEVVERMVTDDFEFYHDKGGQIAKTRSEFVANVKSICQRAKENPGVRNRRELVAGTMQVFPMAKYGALHTGEHRFYETANGKPDRITSVARFVHLWKKEGDTWKLARVYSYDHRQAGER